jgi:hypothetical protein
MTLPTIKEIISSKDFIARQALIEKQIFERLKDQIKSGLLQRLPHVFVNMECGDYSEKAQKMLSESGYKYENGTTCDIKVYLE